MVKVSIIIATASRPEPLRETLRSLNAVKVPTDLSVEIVLVENVARSGAESALDEITSPTLARKYLFEPQRGKSRALNRAIREATGDIFLFTDDDVRLPGDWIRRMCEPIASGRADAVAGGVRLAPHLLRNWMNRTHRASLASTADYLAREAPSEMCGANMAIRRAVFDHVAGFDPEIGPGVTGGGEESLLSWQLRQAGFKMVGALDVEVEHHPSVDRLQYATWVRAARLKGETRAYQLYHWFHETLPWPRLSGNYWNLKLLIRRVLTHRPQPTDEGIAPWELSYHEEVAKYRRYLAEAGRARQYPRHGLRKAAS